MHDISSTNVVIESLLGKEELEAAQDGSSKRARLVDEFDELDPIPSVRFGPPLVATPSCLAGLAV